MLGIIILNYKTWEETIKCVESILCTAQVDFRIYIVDNHSENSSYEKLSEKYKYNASIICIEAGENGGFAKGNNIGIQACRKDGILYAIITNNDIIFKDNCIDHMYEVMQRKKNVVQLAPKVIGTAGKFLSPPWSGQQSLLQYLHIRSPKEFIIKEDELKGTSKVYMVPGGCFMIDVEKFVGMGAFDENTFLYNEEGIISVKAKNAGYDILYDSDAVVVHNHGASTEKGNLFSDAEILKSGMYYWSNYEKVSKQNILFIYIFMIIRMSLKVILGRAKATNYWKYMNECWIALRKILSKID